MKIKSVTIEMENGQELTMGMDKVEDFFQSVERLKQAAAPKPEEEPTEYDQTQDPMWIQHQLAARERAMQAVLSQQQQQRVYTNSSGTSSIGPPIIGNDPRSTSAAAAGNWKLWEDLTS